MSRVILLGASGLLGDALVNTLGERVVARTYLTRATDGAIRFDVRSDSLSELIRTLPVHPDVALILLGVTNIDACARDPIGTARTNVEGIVRAVRDLDALRIQPVFASTDGVFEGGHAFWSEFDEPRPILTYGRQKVEVERFLTSRPRPFITIRLPKLLATVPDDSCILTQWVRKLGSRETIRCATDQFFTPAAAADAARAIVDLIDAGEHGLYHLGGPQRLSRRELLEATIDEYRRFGDVTAAIVDCSLRDIPVVEPRPLDTSLDSSRFRARIGERFRPAAEIARLAVRGHFEG
jgi:dTDP-4-dehydrorhamnose reductase